MGERTRGRKITVAFACLLVSWAVACLAKPPSVEAKVEIYGKWVNDLYTDETYLFIYETNGAATCYTKWSDQPVYKGRFLIEKQWKDTQGNTYYKVVEIWRRSSFYSTGEAYNMGKPGQWSCFKIHKLNATGNLLESVWSYEAYPKMFTQSPVDGFYQVHYRQQ
jgi:hypothetical protein